MRLTVAGRTDAGVHALGQVASFEFDGEVPDGLAKRVNAVSPRDVVVVSAAPAPDGFDARRDARSRSYLYRVWTAQVPSPFEEGRALWWRYELDDDALAACAVGPGRHARLHRLHADRVPPTPASSARSCEPNGRATAAC